MRFWSRRSVLASAVLVGLLPSSTLFAAGQPDTINIDWATYNPVSMLLKDHGWLEKEFEKDGIKIRWVQTLGSNKALEFLNAGADRFRLHRRLRRAARQDQRQSDQGDLCLLQAGMDRAGHAQGYQHQDRRRSQGQARRGHPRHRPAHLPGTRPAKSRHDRKGYPAGAAAASGRRHRAYSRRCRCLGRPRSDDGASGESSDGARLFYRDADANTYGILNVREEFAKDHPDLVKRVLTVYETARKYALAHPDELEKSFIAATKLPKDVVEKQLRERTDLSNGKIGKPQRDTILAAGLALQQAGVIKPDVDVQKALDALVDGQYVAVTN